MSTSTQSAATATASTNDVHIMKRHFTLISTKSVDYENLSAFEATALSLALILAVTAGQIVATTGAAGYMG